MLYIEFNNRVEEKAQNNWGTVTDYTRHYLYEKYNALYMSDEYETQEEAANAAAKDLTKFASGSRTTNSKTFTTLQRSCTKQSKIRRIIRRSFSKER